MKRWLPALSLYVVLAIVLAPAAAVGDGHFAFHDFRHHHLPWRAWAAAKFLAGEFPLWASGAANGFPLFAEGQGGFLYLPTMLLFVLLPDGLALDWAVLGHHVLAALGAWWLCRNLGMRGVGPLLAGIVYGFSGFMVSHSLYLGMQNAAAWLPWVLGATLSRQGWLTALGIGAMGLAGHPQAAAFGGLLAGGHAMLVLSGRERLRWIGFAALGGLVAAPQVVASLQLAQFSMRDGGVAASFAQVGALPPQELVGLVLPYAFGFDRPADIVETYYHRGTGYWGAGVNSWEMCTYVGVPAAVLALLGARRRKGWAILALLAALLMLGGPLWSLLHLLPGFGFFRFPARFGLWLTLAVAVLASAGTESLRFAWRREQVRSRLLVFLGLFTLSTGVARLGLSTRGVEIASILDAHFRRQVDLPPPPSMGALLRAALPEPEPEVAAEIPAKVARIMGDLRRSVDPRSPRVIVPVLLLLATLLGLGRPRLLAALVAVDLLGFGRDYHPVADEEPVPRWLSERMTEPGGYRTTVLDRRVPIALDDELLTASTGLPLGTSDVIIPSPLFIVRNEALLASAGLDVGDKGPQKVERFLEHHDVARRMALRFVATVHEIPGLLPVVRGHYNVYEDRDALPRARVVPCRAVKVDGDEAFAALLAADPETTVIVETGDAACEVGGAATIMAYSDTRVEIAATGPGTLVLADLWYPGWTATLDGAVVPVERVDLVFRGVQLPAGEHVVVFSYRPAWFYGLLGVSLALTAGLLLTRRR